MASRRCSCGAKTWKVPRGKRIERILKLRNSAQRHVCRRCTSKIIEQALGGRRRNANPPSNRSHGAVRHRPFRIVSVFGGAAKQNAGGRSGAGGDGS